MNIVSAGGVKQNIYPCDLYPTDLNGEPEFEPVERVADPDLALDLRVGERGHDCPRLDVGPARRNIPKQ